MDSASQSMGALVGDLIEVAGLLRKYKHYGQATVAEEIAATFVHEAPDYKRLSGIEMWGGAGAVWETVLSLHETNETRVDERAFREAIIRISATMDRLKVGTTRSHDIGAILQGWKQKNLRPWG